jgi:organic hydroperoxide reductase OsmC/OhrA
MPRQHTYEVTVTWTGDLGTGTSGYRAFGRGHEVTADGKLSLPGSADPAFRGDPARWNPEELLVASLSQCHMLWFLVLCAREKIVVTGYTDRPHGTMVETPEGSGRFERVVLRPEVVLAPGQDTERAAKVHERAHQMCFIANSVNFPVEHELTFQDG